MKLHYDRYCPSTTVDSAEYVYPNARCEKICTIKELLEFHLRATHHQSCETDETYVDDTFIKIKKCSWLKICLTPNMEKFLEQTWEFEYE